MVFTTLDIIQLKKIDDYENVYSVNPLYLNQVDILSATPLKKKVYINIWFLILQMKIKSYLKKKRMFLMELETKSNK